MNVSLSCLQQVKELKKSRDQANKAKEELDLKKRYYERKKNEMEQENQLLKATNVRLYKYTCAARVIPKKA